MLKKRVNKIINDFIINIEFCCLYCYFEKLHEGHKIFPIKNEELLKKENISLKESTKEFNDIFEKVEHL